MNAGDRFGRYQIVRMIGHGAMGEVFLARDTEERRDVALKIVYKGDQPEDQEIINAERLGAELQKRLSGADKRVVTVRRYGEINGTLFIEMEYIEGEDLSMILTRGAVEPGFAVHVTYELCEMLENLSAFTTIIDGRQFAGVVHGDLKPRNVRLNRQNQVKVLDFGIAKALSYTHRYTLNVFASTAYSSPERVETQKIDSRSDLWSVGVMFYQMLAGRLPFEDTDRGRLERRIRSPHPPEPLPPHVPEPLNRIALKMLARDPEQRYATPIEVAQDLARYRTGQPVLAEAPVLDNEATVRTAPSFVEQTFSNDATVRTAKPAAIAWPPKNNYSRTTQGCVWAFAAAVVVAVIFAVLQYRVSNRAAQLKQDLLSERASNLDDAWTQFQTLNASAHLPFEMWGAKNALEKRLVGAADDTILTYRNNDAPAIYEPQWQRAKTYLARAMQLDPDNTEVRGRYRLCEGHIDRIEAGRQKTGAARQQLLDAAIEKFQQAATLLKRSPDPYLGLARLYVYDLGDVDRAEQALNEAEKYGHPMGKRERAQLADGYRRRADRFWRESRGFAQLPGQERDYLNKALDDYKHAEDLYQQTGVFGDSSRNNLLSIQGEQRVQQRLNELNGDAAQAPSPAQQVLK